MEGGKSGAAGRCGSGWVAELWGRGLIPELEKASLTHIAPTPSLVGPGATSARGQRWVSPSLGLQRPRAFRTAEAALRAAVRVSKATPGGHRGDDSGTAVLPPRRGTSRPSRRGRLRLGC